MQVLQVLQLRHLHSASCFSAMLLSPSLSASGKAADLEDILRILAGFPGVCCELSRRRGVDQQYPPVISTLCEKGLLGALRCTESHGNNQCQIASPISAFWTDLLIVLYAPDTCTFTLGAFLPLHRQCG